MVVPVTSLCLKSSLNLAMKFGYVPRVIVPVVSTEFSWKVVAQVRVDPLVM